MRKFSIAFLPLILSNTMFVNDENLSLPSTSIEHDDIEVVAVNDPFIDPKYAVSILKAP